VQGELPLDYQEVDAKIIQYPNGSGARLVDGKIIEADDFRGEGMNE